MELPVHKHLIIRTEVNNPPGKDKQEYIKDWFRTLVKDIGMKLLAGPYCEYVDVPGNEGLTCVCIICLLYTSPSPRDGLLSRMPSSA